MKKRQRATAIPAPAHYVPAAGSPFSETDMLVIGPALARIAEQNRVEDLRSLDKHLVYEAVEADPHHPLRPFLNWDDLAAARLHRIAQVQTLIRSVRIITVQMGKRSSPEPMFIHVPDAAKRPHGATQQRSQVLMADVLNNDPAYASALSSKMRVLQSTFRQLEHVVNGRGEEAPTEFAMFCQEVRAAIDRYNVRVTTARNSAAE